MHHIEKDMLYSKAWHPHLDARDIEKPAHKHDAVLWPPVDQTLPAVGRARVDVFAVPHVRVRWHRGLNPITPTQHREFSPHLTLHNDASLTLPRLTVSSQQIDLVICYVVKKQS